MSLLASEIRKDFPIFQRKINGRPMVYLDNAATSQKPIAVLNRIRDYYERENSNVHRGIHTLSMEATEAYEQARKTTASFIGVPSGEVIFTKGTTESINLLASTWGESQVGPGDTIAVTRMEHHSNFVPWQALAKRRGAHFEIVELTDEGQVDLVSLKQVLAKKPKLLAFTMMSNVLGTKVPVRQIAELAHESGAKVVVDAAQAVSQVSVKVPELGPIDFLAFSGHKMCGPTGIGVLWGRKSLLEAMPPYQYGGGMILNVQDQETSWASVPEKFEAGTPHVAGAVGLEAAIQYLEKLGMDQIDAYKRDLTAYAIGRLQTLPGIRIFGPKNIENRGGVVSFETSEVHPHDLSTFLDTRGVAVRAGHHCCQPLMKNLGVAATSRASFYIYNDREDVDVLVDGIAEAGRYFKG